MIVSLVEQSYFITGTDTNCGKTYVTCHLLTQFIQQKKRAQALKPVVSGAKVHGHCVTYDDVVKLQQHSTDPTLKINHWHYPLAISPHIASKLAGETLTSQAIVNFCQQSMFSSFDYLLVEGAGGVLAPINDNETWLDVMTLMAVPVILVVGMRLGCLNHALLSAAALSHAGVECAGWVANCVDNAMVEREENIATLKKRMPMPYLMTLAYQARSTFDNIQHSK